MLATLPSLPSLFLATLVIAALATGQEQPGPSALHAAAQKGDTDRMRELLDAHPDWVRAEDDSQRLALHLAARYGKLEAVDLLLERGSPIDHRAYNRFTPLHLAVSFHRKQVVERLLEKGADVEAVTAFGKRPLQLAADANRAELVEVLFEHGAAYDLHTACCLGDAKRVRELGQDPATRVDHYTFRDAIRRGHADVVRALLQIPAKQMPPLINMEVRLPLLFYATAHVDVVRALIEGGEDPTQTMSTTFGPSQLTPDSTLAHLAAAGGHLETLRYLLDGPLEDALDARDRKQQTPFLRAAAGGRTQTMAELADRGADIAASDRQGRTAVHLAAVAGHLDAVRWLVARGSLLDETDKRGRTALALTAEQLPWRGEGTAERMEMLELLRALGSPVDLHAAAVLGDVLRARALLAKPDIEPTAYIAARAIAHHRIAVLEAFLDGGLPIEATDERQRTLLHVAAFWSEADAVRLLLARGAVVDAKNKFRMTPLHDAVRSNAAEAAQLLLEAGADPDLVDEDSKRPADYLNQYSSAALRELFR